MKGGNHFLMILRSRAYLEYRFLQYLTIVYMLRQDPRVGEAINASNNETVPFLYSIVNLKAREVKAKFEIPIDSYCRNLPRDKLLISNHL